MPIRHRILSHPYPGSYGDEYRYSLWKTVYTVYLVSFKLNCNNQVITDFGSSVHFDTKSRCARVCDVQVERGFKRKKNRKTSIRGRMACIYKYNII